MSQRISILLITLGFVCSVVSCIKEVPKPTMEETKLVNLLADIHFAEAAMNNVYGKVKDSLANLYYEQVFTMHEIDSTVFQEQIDLLRKTPVHMEKVYEKVLTIVNTKDAALKKKK